MESGGHTEAFGTPRQDGGGLKDAFGKLGKLGKLVKFGKAKGAQAAEAAQAPEGTNAAEGAQAPGATQAPEGAVGAAQAPEGATQGVAAAPQGEKKVGKLGQLYARLKKELPTGSGPDGDGSSSGGSASVGGAGPKPFTSLADILSTFMVGVGQGAKMVPMTVAAMPAIWGSMWAMACIAGAVCVLLIVLYLVYRINPRWVTVSHSEDLETYMKGYLADLVGLLETLRDGARRHSGSWLARATGQPDLVAKLHAQLEEVVGGATSSGGKDNGRQGSLAADLAIYFTFYNSLTNDNWATRSDIRNNLKQFAEDDGTLHIDGFKESVVTPMDNLGKTLVKISDALAQAPGLGDLRAAVTPWTPDRVAYATALHQLRMMLDQKTEIAAMAMTRRWMATAIWTVYYIPWVMEVFKNRIPGYWKKFPKRYAAAVLSGTNWWLGLGAQIALIPCKAAYTDPDERAEKCNSYAGKYKEKDASPDHLDNAQATCEAAYDDPVERAAKCGGDSGGTADTSGGAAQGTQATQATEGFVGGRGGSGNDGEDVLEGFGLANIGKALSSIGAFFINLGSVAAKVGEFFVMFPIDPFGSIIGLLSIFFGTWFGLIILMLYLILTFTGAFFVVLVWWVTLTQVIGGFFYTWYLAILTLLVAIPYFGLWMIDLPTHGLVVRLMRCENNPADWWTKPAYAEGNRYYHAVPLCFNICGRRYRPTESGCCCQRVPSYMPDFCPQQQAFRILRAASGAASSASGGGGLSMTSGLSAIAGAASKGPPDVFDRYAPESGFARLRLPAKRAAIAAAYKEKVAWYQRCYSALSDKDYLNRHICNNVDLHPGLDVSTRKALALACRECFCKFEQSDGDTADSTRTRGGHQGGEGTDGNRQSCARLAAVISADGAEEADPASAGGTLLVRTLLLAVVTLCVLFAVFSMLETDL